MNKIRSWLAAVDKYFYRKLDDWDVKKEILKKHYFRQGVYEFASLIIKFLISIFGK